MQSHVWLISLNIMLLGLIHVIAVFSRFFFSFLNFIVWIRPILFTHSLIDGRLGCFPYLAIINDFAETIHTQLFLWMCIFISLGKIWKSKIAESCSKFIVSFLRNFRAVFQRSCLSLHSSQQYMRARSSHTFANIGCCLSVGPTSRCKVCEVVHRCGLNLHFPNDAWRSIFHVLVSYWYVLFGAYLNNFPTF